MARQAKGPRTAARQAAKGPRTAARLAWGLALRIGRLGRLVLRLGRLGGRAPRQGDKFDIFLLLGDIKVVVEGP